MLACLLLPQLARATHLPLWEVGGGVGTLNAPSYRGSETDVELALPIPYVVYRGDFLEVDQEEGVRGNLFENASLNLDLSLAGSLPVRDTDEGARSGMDGLDPLIEAGIELEINFWRSAERTQKLGLVVPYRLALSVGDPLVDYQGWTLSPFLSYRIFQRRPASLTRYSFSLGPIYASRRYHEYFYSVDSEFVTPQRALYTPDEGYSGSRVTISVAHNTGNYFLGAFVRYDNLQDAEFIDSPLVETRDYLAFGVAFSWIFYASKTTLDH